VVRLGTSNGCNKDEERFQVGLHLS